MRYLERFAFACNRALPAMLRVRADERPSLSALDALVATSLLVTRFDELLAIGYTSIPARVRCTLGSSLAKVKTACAPPSTWTGTSVSGGTSRGAGVPGSTLRADHSW